MVRKIHNTSTEKVCKSKGEGGLSIRDPVIWNKGAYIGLLWKVIYREDSIWVQWMREYLLRGKYLWTMEIPSNYSWITRGMLKVRKQACKLIQYRIVNGSNTSLWYDPWLVDTPLLRLEEARQMIQLPLNAKVAELSNGNS